MLFQVDAQKHTLAKYLMELTLVDYDMARMLPSQIAAAALYLSIHLIDKKAEWVNSFSILLYSCHCQWTNIALFQNC